MNSANCWQEIPFLTFAEAWKPTISPHHTFLQSPRYGIFRGKLGEFVTYFAYKTRSGIVASALCQIFQTRWRRFAHIPHGPVFSSSLKAAEKEAIWKDFLDFYAPWGRQQSLQFVRVAPLEFSAENWRPAAVHLMNPERTWILDLSPSLKELQTQMKKSTRYEVRRAEKVGLRVEMKNNSQALNTFWQLHQATIKRQKFTPFPRKNTEIQQTIWQHDMQFFTAYDADHTPLASTLILFDPHQAYYHQGSSVSSKLPAAHATLWQAIQEAKQRGCKYFNFWGVVADEEKNHPWYGLSRFKKGFGGQEFLYPHCSDFSYSWQYPLTRTLERFRRWRRGY